MKKRKHQIGVTLIELMIVIAIIGIIAAIAYPSYQEQVKGARRVDATSALTGLANAMERHYTANNSYTGAGAAGGDTGSPSIYADEAPLDGNVKFYDLSIQSATATTYTLRATPKGGQVGDGYLELLSTGQRRWDTDNSGGITTTENDWAK